jgi:hypothetical protein
MFVNRPLILLIAGVLCAWLPAKAQNAGSDPSAERWMEPTEANGPTFDTRMAKNRGVASQWRCSL